MSSNGYIIFTHLTSHFPVARALPIKFTKASTSCSKSSLLVSNCARSWPVMFSSSFSTWIRKRNELFHDPPFDNHTIDPIHKGASLFLSYTNMNKMNSLHHVKEHPKISSFLQFESQLAVKVSELELILDLCSNGLNPERLSWKPCILCAILVCTCDLSATDDEKKKGNRFTLPKYQYVNLP